MFNIEFGNHEWSRIDEDMFWVGDIPFIIDDEMIHKLTSLSNEGCNLVNEKNIKKLVEIQQQKN